MRRGTLLSLVVVALLVSGCSRSRPAEVIYKTPMTAAGSVIVVRGDSVYAIARRHDVSIRGVIEANQLSPPYTLQIGQRLVLPAERVHVVVSGDSLYDISRRYGVDMTVLVRANRLTPPYRLSIGQRLRLPSGGATPPSPPTVVAQPAPSATPQGYPPPPPSKPSRRTVSAAAAAPLSPRTVPAPPPRSNDTFLWPVSGTLLVGYGPKPGGFHNDGINIAAPSGTAVRAAEDGVVAYTGNELRGYGNLVLLRHAGGWVTAYAHNDTLLVDRGDTVRRGQLIARVGSSGGVATPQSHFELRRGTESIDPTPYMVWN